MLYTTAGIYGLDLRGVWVQPFDYSATQFGPFTYGLNRFAKRNLKQVLRIAFD